MSAIRSVLLVACLFAAACQSTPSAGESWIKAEIAAPSENVLWAVAGQEMQRMGFPVGSDADPSTMVMRSGWATHLAPFRGQGFRVRAEVRLTKTAPDRYQIESRVERNDNMDVTRPLDPSSAKWEAAADDLEKANVLVQRIRARLGDPLEVAAPRKSNEMALPPKK